ncbi:MFS transporter [Paraburkholderia acidisoli]|uniref:MFS transporter n=1 Tax=Paraburkholderia acidisoli TaxID=2571748 RepID=A0A7Z2GKE6_9BURK|nr:MFS transporter [Paraburkholderia acidisoli]QGZ63420.1 MFS transporter [Paraburkholderia acidisoli]
MDLEQQVMKRVMYRLMPVLIVCYLISYIDRSNLAVAAIAMNRELGLSPADYGFAAGIFFLGYVICEIPSNIFLAKLGARLWISRIMLTWGLLSGAMAFAVGPKSLFVLRILLGIAEAGLFPGLIFYISFWFPSTYRARAFGWFLVVIPLSIVIGAPLSASILYMDGMAGLSGWQWVFVLEAAPAVLFSFFCFFFLTDTPAKANWLSEPERKWLMNRIARDVEHVEAHGQSHGRGEIMAAFAHPRVWLLSLINVALIACSYGCVFFMPLIVSDFGFTKMQTGLITALPFLAAAIATIAWGRKSDRAGERKLHLILPLLVAVVGFVIAAEVDTVTVKMIGLGLAACGTFASLSPFWSLPPTFLKGTGAAAGIAMINTIGSLAGFGAPYLMGYVKQHTGSYGLGLLIIGASALIAAALALRIRSDEAPLRRTA